jgi:peptidoglycan-associated lipoprotein
MLKRRLNRFHLEPERYRAMENARKNKGRAGSRHGCGDCALVVSRPARPDPFRGGNDEDGVSMRVQLKGALLGAAMIGALGVSGCATEDFVRQQVGGVDQKVTANQSRLDQHDARLAGLDKSSREAMERAEAAGKLAEGKFLYSMVLSDDGVKFARNSADLSPEAKTRLMDFIQKLKSENRNVYLEIQGHTDSKGSPAANMALGEERAETVRRFLYQQGVPLNRMSTISYGDTTPAAPNDTPAGRAQNRRVVLVVMA